MKERPGDNINPPSPRGGKSPDPRIVPGDKDRVVTLSMLDRRVYSIVYYLNISEISIIPTEPFSYLDVINLELSIIVAGRNVSKMRLAVAL